MVYICSSFTLLHTTMEPLTNLVSWLTPTTLFLLLNFTIGTIFFINRVGSGSRKHHPPHQDGFGSGHVHAPATLARSSSLIDRIKSINFHLYSSPSTESETRFSGSDPHPNTPPSLLERVKSFNLPYFKFPQHNSEGDYAAYDLLTRPEETRRVDPINVSQLKVAEDDPAIEPIFEATAPTLLQRVKSIKLSSLYRSETDPNSDEQNPVTMKKKAMTKSSSDKSGVGYIGRKEEETVEVVEKRRPETTRVERTASTSDEDEGVDDKASDFINKFKQQLKLQRLDSFLRNREMFKNK